MKSELKKLKGISIKANIGEICFRQYMRLQSSEFDQIYFKTNQLDSICKVYDLSQPVSTNRFRNEMEMYSERTVPTLYDNIRTEQFKYKKKDYGLVTFVKLGKEDCLSQLILSLDSFDIKRLTYSLLTTILALKQQNKVYFNIRPQNIYRVKNQFMIINAEYMARQSSPQNADPFVVQLMQKDWTFWPPQALDPYNSENFDYSLDLYAAGCIIYYVKTGKFPFQSKLSALSNDYQQLKQDNNDIISIIIKNTLCKAEIRRKLNLKILVEKLKKQIQTESPKLSIKQQIKMKSINKKNVTIASPGILDNLSSVISKARDGTQGNYLNYVEDNDKEPAEKYLENILYKFYRSQDKIEKLSMAINKNLLSNKRKHYSIMKTVILIGHLIRKGPAITFQQLSPILQDITQNFNQPRQAILLAQLLKNKIKFHRKLCKYVAGNFYLHDVSNFKVLQIDDLSQMISYLQKLVNALKKITSEFKETEIQGCMVNLVCDDIYDLVSMLIMSIVAIRKDNQLQLRNDNLVELPKIQKKLNTCLKKISNLSNFTGAHAIYSLENQYIPYQEQINLSSNPYYSSLQHFYKSSRSYKGLTLPQNFENMYCLNQSAKKSYLPDSPKIYESPISSKKYFKSDEVQSQEEDNGKLKNLQKAHQNVSFQGFAQFMDMGLNKPKGPQNKILTKKSKQQNKSEKDSQKSKNSNSVKKKTTGSQISFEQFGNIIVSKSKSSQPNKLQNKTSKIHEDFLMFGQSNEKKSIKTPYIPKPKNSLNNQNNNKQKVIANTSKTNFDEFNRLMVKSNEKPQMKDNPFLLQFDQLHQIQKPAFDGKNNPFTESKPPQLIPCPPVEQNPLLQSILKGLKLKQLKDLLRKNTNFLIQYKDLQIIKAIGSGSAGQVFYGKYNNQQVAIKKVKCKQNPNALKQFERQLVTYIKIKKNPHLVSLIGLSEQKGQFYLITQFCQAGSLFDLLHKKRNQIQISWKQRLEFCIQIAQGMLFLHEMKPVIIHRDLKSLNVFVAKQGQNYKMKVADFGLSRSPQAEMMTTQLGTIHWMAPQLLQGKQYSIKVDVYSYGVLMWEILSRRTPYSNLQNPMAILKYVVIDKQRPDLTQVSLQCPNQLLDIVKKCWSHDASVRPTFSNIIKQLKTVSL